MATTGEDRSKDEFRRKRAEEACAREKNPSHELRAFAVTGTKGKTTSAFLLQALLTGLGHRCALMGTVENRFEEWRESAKLTTPGSDDLQKLLAYFRGRGADAAVMEVSSHALDQFRTWGTRFMGAIFTNLSQDHLDYHPDMERYYAAKRRLFFDYECTLRVVNVTGPWGRRLADELKAARLPVITVGPSNADLCYGGLTMSAQGLKGNLTGTVNGRAATVPLDCRLMGAFNAQNVAGVAAIGLALGAGGVAVGRIIDGFPGVPGRMEVVTAADAPFSIIVDYAHAPDALENALTTLRPLTKGKLICVFGCGGDRDRGKRPMMGAIAARLCDKVYVTSDNPRSESPDSIVSEIMGGARGATHVTAVTDRRHAINAAVKGMAEGDVLLIAGKGHETYQIIGDKTLPFDDREEAMKALGQY